MAYPRSEQETILVYDVQGDSWSIYTEYPPHIRKYKQFVENPILKCDENGNEESLQGELTGGVVKVSKKRILSDEEREKLAERARKNLQGKGE